MKTLMLYATYSGGTQIAVQSVEAEFVKKNHSVTLKTPSQVNPDEIPSFDCIIFASPSWDYEGKGGQPHEEFFSLFPKLEKLDLSGKKIAIFGLGDTSYPEFCGAVDVLEKFVTDHKGTLSLPSHRINGFLFNQEEETKKLVEWASTFLAHLS